MPKQKKYESVLHDWVHELTFQQQALLLTGMRGPDACNKHNSAKAIVRLLRGAVVKPAGKWSGLNDNDFMWGEYYRESYPYSEDYTTPEDHIFIRESNSFFHDHDSYPHHFIMHLIHCAEVVGYKHPDHNIANYWRGFYQRACKEFHMTPETLGEMDARLNDFQPLV